MEEVELDVEYILIIKTKETTYKNESYKKGNQ